VRNGRLVISALISLAVLGRHRTSGQLIQVNPDTRNRE